MRPGQIANKGSKNRILKDVLDEIRRRHEQGIHGEIVITMDNDGIVYGIFPNKLHRDRYPEGGHQHR